MRKFAGRGCGRLWTFSSDIPIEIVIDPLLLQPHRALIVPAVGGLLQRPVADIEPRGAIDLAALKALLPLDMEMMVGALDPERQLPVDAALQRVGVLHEARRQRIGDGADAFVERAHG
jgi:hypothetical protein